MRPDRSCNCSPSRVFRQFAAKEKTVDLQGLPGLVVYIRREDDEQHEPQCIDFFTHLVE